MIAVEVIKTKETYKMKGLSVKLVYRIAVVLLSICPLLQADDTDIGAYGHVVSNRTNHAVYVHLDISGSDAAKVIGAGEAWTTGKTEKVNKWEVRDYETGMWVANVNPAEDGGKYQLLIIEPGAGPEYKGSTAIWRYQVQARYNYRVERLHDRF